MKLINKISSYFLISSVIVFAVLASTLYFVIENSITSELDEQLLNIYNKTAHELQKGNKTNFPPFIEIQEIRHPDFVQEFRDVNILSTGNENEPYREYHTITNVNGKTYEVFLRISLIEKDEMILSIFSVTAGTLFLFLLILFLVNKYSSGKIFKDFYSTLNALDNFSLMQKEKLILTNSRIAEFAKLNDVVEHLAKKAQNEYRSLKEFTEETNHEMLTPAAVVKSKLELLLQSNSLKEDELNLLNSALTSLNKLERISKSILLLNKLQHKNLFNDSQLVIADEVDNTLESFHDFLSAKNISLNISLDRTLCVKANASLLNILLSNLISNAIRHNKVSGNIFIELKNKRLLVANSTVEPKENPSRFFDRFLKEPKESESIGLGLTIVKKICDLYAFDIKNSYTDNFYTIVVDFI